MPDRFEQKRDELVKKGMTYQDAQTEKEPEIKKPARRMNGNQPSPQKPPKRNKHFDRAGRYIPARGESWPMP